MKPQPLSGIQRWKNDRPTKENWMAAHHIFLSYNCGADEWCAEILGTGPHACHKDPDGALHNLAVKLGIKDWEGK